MSHRAGYVGFFVHELHEMQALARLSVVLVSNTPLTSLAEYVRHALTADTDVSAVPLVSAVFERSEVDEKHMRLSRRRWKSVGFVVLPEFLADALDRHQGFTLRGLERVVGVRVEMPRHHRGRVIERLRRRRRADRICLLEPHHLDQKLAPARREAIIDPRLALAGHLVLGRNSG
jgi:hypothetical protein